MGDVAIHFRVMPEGIETDLEAIKVELKKLGAKHIEEKPVGFGLKSLEVIFITPDKEGQTFEDKIRAIPGVESVETEGVTLI